MGASSSAENGERAGVAADENRDNNARGETSNDQQQPEKYHKHCFFRYITAFARLWGIVLFIGLWGCCVQGFRSKNHPYAKFYLLGVAVIVTFLELVWMINKCACCREDGCCIKAWRAVVWIDDWRKTIIYLLFSAPCFTEQLRDIFTILAAGLLIMAAFLYFMKSFRDSSCVKHPLTDDAESQRRPTTTTDPKAKLIATEQRTYDAIAQQADTTSVTSSERGNNYTPVTTPEPDKYSPEPEEAKEEVEEIPVGYKFDYGTAAGQQAGRSRSTNPFDEENGVTDGPGDVISKNNDVTTAVKARAPSTNPFDDDEDSFEYKPRQRPLSRDPFE